MPKKEIKAPDIERLKTELNKMSVHFPQVIAAYLFGSHAGGRPTPVSDVDIGIILADKLPDMESFRIEMNLLGELEKILDADNVDLVVLNKAPLPIQYQATCGKLLFTSNEEKRTGFVEYVRKYYIDCLPIYREYKEECLKRIREGCGTGGEFSKGRQATSDA